MRYFLDSNLKRYYCKNSSTYVVVLFSGTVLTAGAYPGECTEFLLQYGKLRQIAMKLKKAATVKVPDSDCSSEAVNLAARNSIIRLIRHY